MSRLAVPLDALLAAAALSTMTAEFTGLLDSMSIPLDVQAKLGSLGYTDMVVFAQMEESATALRASI
eukprot:16411195-Heterocapsa_arctica.AAC.1